jgi:hypothetical protein
MPDGFILLTKPATSVLQPLRDACIIFTASLTPISVAIDFLTIGKDSSMEEQVKPKRGFKVVAEGGHMSQGGKGGRAAG